MIYKKHSISISRYRTTHDVLMKFISELTAIVQKKWTPKLVIDNKYLKHDVQHKEQHERRASCWRTWIPAY